jgi:hypothetical protein
MKSITYFLPLLLATRLAFAHDASVEMAAAANNFLATLTAEQKAKVAFPFPDAERENWHFIPRARKGLPFKEMTQEQRLLAQALLASGLSHRGYAKAVSIMSLETVLLELEKGSGPVRDPEMYFVTIFGTPGVEPWGWRLEGHHLSQNFTALGGEAPSMTPSFFGSNPGEVLNGPRKGTRILGNEEELGRKLIKSLNAEQQKIAIINADAPKDILNDPKRVDPTKPEGIVADKLDGDQLEMLVKLIKEYLFRNRPDVAAEEFARIEKDGAGKVTFAWAGGLERGQPHYYRVQGTTFVLEYDNTQNDANHVHSLWRDFAHDFDRDLLAKHLQEAHSK